MTQDNDLPSIEDEPTNMSFAQLYKELVVQGSLIVDVPLDEVDILRKGLTQFKTKQNVKLKDSNLAPDTSVLKYNLLGTEEEREKNQIASVQIILSPRAGVTVLKIQLPDDTL